MCPRSQALKTTGRRGSGFTPPRHTDLPPSRNSSRAPTCGGGTGRGTRPRGLYSVPSRPTSATGYSPSWSGGSACTGWSRRMWTACTTRRAPVASRSYTAACSPSLVSPADIVCPEKSCRSASTAKIPRGAPLRKVLLLMQMCLYQRRLCAASELLCVRSVAGTSSQTWCSLGTLCRGTESTSSTTACRRRTRAWW